MPDTAVRKDSEPEIDQELLEEATRQVGATWPNEAINQALRELVTDRRERRGRAFDRLQEMADEGGFNFAAIDEADR